MTKTKHPYISSPLLQRAQEHDFTSDDHYVNILDKGDDAFLARVHLIRAAKKSILIQTFIWRDDECGTKILSELFEAAKRGVKVKIQLDHWVLNKEKGVLNFLNFRHPNFAVLIYNPPAKKLDLSALEFIQKAIVDFNRINQRMHNKTFIVDEQIAIVGGRNYDNMYYDRGARMTFIDMDLMVTGKVVGDVLKSFEQYWGCGMSIRPFDFKDIEEDTFDTCERRLKQAIKSFEYDLFEEVDGGPDDYARIEAKFNSKTYTTAKIRFVFDQPEIKFQGKERENTGVLRDLHNLIVNATQSITVQSPYFILSDHALEHIRQLRQKSSDISINVSTNSLAATDNVYAYAFLNKEKRLYVKDLNIRLFEMKPTPVDMTSLVNDDVWQKNKGQKLIKSQKRDSKHLCLHAKVFIIDRSISWVGTFNVDVRSEYYNTEIAFIIDDDVISAVIEDKIQKMQEPRNSWVIAPKRYIKGVTEFNDWMTIISRWMPVIDLWPFRNISCFDLIDGKPVVEITDGDFYLNYRNIGMFPQVVGKIMDKKILINLIQMFGQIIKPIV